MTHAAWAASADAVAHVLVDALDDEVVLDGPAGHHLERVRRLRPGEPVTAGDGLGGWRPYTVATATRGRLLLTATGAPRAEPRLAPPLAVAFALTKGSEPDRVVAGVTELGVDAILPVLTRRSVVRATPERLAATHDRLGRVARAAAEQCRRARVPEVAAPGPLAALAGREGLVVADRSGAPAAAIEPPPPGGWIVVVGPEGGFELGETEALGPASRLGVGPHVLRAVTAALAAVAALSGRRTPSDGHGA